MHELAWIGLALGVSMLVATLRDRRGAPRWTFLCGLAVTVVCALALSGDARSVGGTLLATIAAVTAMITPWAMRRPSA